MNARAPASAAVDDEQGRHLIDGNVAAMKSCTLDDDNDDDDDDGDDDDDDDDGDDDDDDGGDDDDDNTVDSGSDDSINFLTRISHSISSFDIITPTTIPTTPNLLPPPNN